MPPKKNNKGKKSGSTVTHRSFKNKETVLDYELDEVYETNKTTNDNKNIQDEEPEETIEEKESKLAEQADQGVFSYYMALVDIYINTRHVFQLFMLFFVTNLLYLVFKEREDNGDENAMDYIVNTSCILLAILLEGFAVLNSRFTQFNKNKTTIKPQLLDFNYIYSVYLPLAICLLKAPNKVIVISCCVAQLGYMNMFVRTLISYVILIQFSTEMITAHLLLLPIGHCFFFEMINKFVGNELPIYEKSFFSILYVALSYFITIQDSNITLFIMKNLVLSFTAGTIFASPILELYKGQVEKSLKYTWLFAIYLIFSAAGLIISDKLLLPVLNQFHLNWLIEFIKSSKERTDIFQAWIIATIVLIPTIFLLFNKVFPTVNLSIKRKIWHFVLFGMLVKPMKEQPELVSIALFGILGLLVVVEMIRSNELPPFGKSIKELFRNFEDEKDNDGKFTLSYIYLLIGVSLPFWLNNVDGLRESSYIGLITLGLGDSFASIVGGKVGYSKWPMSNKSIEGSITMGICTFLGYILLDYINGSGNDKLEVLNWTNRCMVAVLSALFEGIVDVNDNLYVPVFAYLVEELLMNFN